MSLAYGWTPVEINQLTMFQAVLYLSDNISERGTIRMKLADAMALRLRNTNLPEMNGN